MQKTLVIAAPCHLRSFLLSCGLQCRLRLDDWTCLSYHRVWSSRTILRQTASFSRQRPKTISKRALKHALRCDVEGRALNLTFRELRAIFLQTTLIENVCLRGCI